MNEKGSKLEHEHKIINKKDESANIILDSVPICCSFWNRNLQIIDCNQHAVELFELTSKQEYLEKFDLLSPDKQANGQSSKEMLRNNVAKCFELSELSFEWVHQTLKGEQIPCDIFLVRVKCVSDEIVVAYTRDMRVFKAYVKKLLETDERTRIMLDATPLCCNFWNEDLKNVDCNQEAVNLFELTSKQEYLDRFFELSPVYQPDGRPSMEKAEELVRKAFEVGRLRFEWMHQKINGEPIPSQVTLVRVLHGDKYIVVGYTHDLRELKSAVQALNKIESIAFTDSLTGVYNRRYFTEKAQKAFFNFDIKENPISIIMFDLDKFKLVNDTYGHQVGDEVLKHVSKTVQSVLRTGDILARYGGEEFILLILQSDAANAERLAWRICHQVAQTPYKTTDLELPITISLGVVTKSTKEMTLDEAVTYADKAMYCAKNNGRNRVECYIVPPKGKR